MVVSVDGMRADFYRRPEEFGLKVPALRKLLQAGASAEAVESVYPSTTYPAHATIVTGVPPRAHGVYSHLASRDPTQAGRPWHWFASALRVPTLWDAAGAAGLKTAAVGWPVSAGASLDYNLPEIWDPLRSDAYSDLETVARHSTPGLFEVLQRALEKMIPRSTHDRIRAEAALYIWKHYRPDILLVHLVGYDQNAHRFGPTSHQALAAIEQSDEIIARIQKAAGDARRVTFVVLSDHGFVPVEKEAAPLTMLAEEGLFDREAGGALKLRRLGAIHAGGSFAVYWLETPTEEDERRLARAVARLGETGAVEEIVTRAKLRALGSDPDAELILDAAPGFYFSDRSEGPVDRASEEDRGTHGHLPTRAGLEASFLIAGPGVKPGKNLGRILLTEIAPTLADALGYASDALATHERPIDLS